MTNCYLSTFTHSLTHRHSLAVRIETKVYFPLKYDSFVFIVLPAQSVRMTYYVTMEYGFRCWTLFLIRFYSRNFRRWRTTDWAEPTSFVAPRNSKNSGSGSSTFVNFEMVEIVNFPVEFTRKQKQEMKLNCRWHRRRQSQSARLYYEIFSVEWFIFVFLFSVRLYTLRFVLFNDPLFSFTTSFRSYLIRKVFGVRYPSIYTRWCYRRLSLKSCVVAVSIAFCLSFNVFVPSLSHSLYIVSS